MLMIRLKRVGAKKRPYYRLVVVDSRCSRDGRVIEQVGYYRPVEKEDQVKLNEQSIQRWISRGIQVSPTVKNILNRNQIYLNR